MSQQAKVNILLVDDQPAKLIAHEAILAGLQENIIKANSGEAALQFLLKHECAVIVLDVNMPGMDGFETAAMIRERPSLERTPIIFMSAYSVSDLDRLKGYGIGAVDYLFIPVVPEVFKAKVQAFVEIFRQRQIISRQADDLARQNREKEEQIRVIQRLNDQLAEANAELEAFSSTVSHDLRAPLRALRGYSEALLLDCKGQLSPQGMDYLTRISKAAGRMDALIQDVLAYTRVSKAELTLQPLDLEALLSSLMETADAKWLPPDRIRVESPLLGVIGHEACLGLCLSNLLSNAVKFVAPDRAPEVRVRTEPRGGRVRIWVEDNGIGIDPSHQARIFEMFGRVHGSAAYEGTGIGLTIVRKGVERLGGTMGVESEVNRGSRFWIELPGVMDRCGPAPSDG